ncbi:TPA: acetate--CoA ligase [Legionella pneumophila]|nr:acetate--CoA ligase [Legionella pneumophila]HAT2067347.1 acetate--CoA ligase [Legionella pneumophila]HAT8593496.1 acetate--CoA ligase [Legionella pneumophila]HAU1577567.1 acetate--CoA ligase [Legionella pneumophila]HAU1681799.1 acetate--CoA ligase [Legionella pneumophila]HAU3701265.1 acetate--CoA ligase [Legionella pneumophila]
MHNKRIKKEIKSDDILLPNLQDYSSSYSSFSWENATKELDSLPLDKGLNIAYEAVDRHTLDDKANKIALRFIGKQNETNDLSFQDLKELSNQFANVLQKLGIGKGDRVYTLTSRIPELYITALGTWKNRSIFCPLFSVFGPEPIYSRLSIGSGKVLITTEELYRKKIMNIRAELPELKYILVIGDKINFENTVNYHQLLAEASTEFTIEPTDPEDIAILHFTSGTTGKPKGAIHAHQAVLAHMMTGKIALDFHSNDIFWCTADPGWVTGTSYGIISPLVNGITSIIDAYDFDAERWLNILEKEKVSIWYTAPTAIRMMMKTGTELIRQHHLPKLRFIASVGEPLNPEAVWWGMDAFNLPIHDNWWQTETGGIMVANYASQDIKPGSMGRPLPGITAAIVSRSPEGTIHFIKEPGVKGELALKAGWPSMFRGYLREEERYKKCFAEGYYLTGDLVTRDEDGYYWFVGRADDIIKSSGHLIGPFEVESVLMEHPAVAEAAVIGKPDPVAMELVKAFISLNPGFQESDELKLEILGFARKHLGVAIAPKEIDILPSIPKTRSGKLMRRLLKARELGLPEGDTSTLETNL